MRDQRGSNICTGSRDTGGASVLIPQTDITSVSLDQWHVDDETIGWNEKRIGRNEIKETEGRRSRVKGERDWLLAWNHIRPEKETKGINLVMFGINVTETRTVKIKFCKRVHLTFEWIWLGDDTRAGLKWNRLEEIRGSRRKEGNYASRMKDHVINVQRTPSSGDIKFQHEKVNTWIFSSFPENCIRLKYVTP